MALHLKMQYYYNSRDLNESHFKILGYVYHRVGSNFQSGFHDKKVTRLTGGQLDKK